MPNLAIFFKVHFPNQIGTWNILDDYTSDISLNAAATAVIIDRLNRVFVSGYKTLVTGAQIPIIRMFERSQWHTVSSDSSLPSGSFTDLFACGGDRICGIGNFLTELLVSDTFFKYLK